jgi:hypothetical protein
MLEARFKGGAMSRDQEGDAMSRDQEGGAVSQDPETKPESNVETEPTTPTAAAGGGGSGGPWAGPRYPAIGTVDVYYAPER